MSESSEFAKYQGTGNDFVMLVDLDDERPLDPREVAALCDRRTGVGADGADPRGAARATPVRRSSWTTRTPTAPRPRCAATASGAWARSLHDRG